MTLRKISWSRFYWWNVSTLSFWKFQSLLKCWQKTIVHNNSNNRVYFREQVESFEEMGAPSKFDHQNQNGATSSTLSSTTVFLLFIAQILIISFVFVYVQDHFTTKETTDRLKEELKQLQDKTFARDFGRRKRDADNRVEVSYYFWYSFISSSRFKRKKFCQATYILICRKETKYHRNLKNYWVQCVYHYFIFAQNFDKWIY